jgi:proline iminopeptidase
VGAIFPREWERFTDAVPPSLRSMRPVDAYAALLRDPDPAVRERAAVEWCAWEDAHVSLAPGSQPNPRYADPAFRQRFARLVTHYWSHDCFLGEDGVLRHADRLEGIPGTMVHGRYDVSSPLVTPWELAKRWTSSTLITVGDAGHKGSDAFRDAFMDALNPAS